MELTRVDRFGGWWAKREDLACDAGPHLPAGSKVRQYLAMAANHPPGTPMIVGCSADSCQQVYVAAAAKQAGCRGVVVVPARAKRTPATEWCAAMGAEVVEVRPGYPSVCRAEAKRRAAELGGCIRWDRAKAVADAADQCANLPECRRVVVPTGSGLTAAGVLAGLAAAGRRGVTVVAVAVSGMAKESVVLKLAAGLASGPLPPFWLVPPCCPYGQPRRAALPDDTPLDSYYAAKAVRHIQDGDCLWVPGRRPVDIN